MADLKARIGETIEELKQQRDELRLQVGLAKLEASEEWHDLEAKLAKLESKTRELGGATADASQDVFAAAKLLAEEIGKGFRKIAQHF